MPETGPLCLRVLVVDDDGDLARLIGHFLRRGGHRPTVVTSSADALATLRDRTALFDVLLTDLAMPAMSGEDLARHSRNLRPELPIVLLTGTIARVEAPALFDALLEKPCPAHELVDALCLVSRRPGPDASGHQQTRR